ncbi:membrane dipeptidase, partial [Undibacterium sp.]|uniref:membrane dipeptidase n=1 Tax=Undibacterium sp. TaxID=1914977 RepID=UPI00374CD0AF
ISGLSFFLGSGNPSADDVARHAAYVAGLVGIEHAGIGLDICFSEEGLDDTPAGDFDPTYWWPSSAGYDMSRPPSFTPVETWKLLPAALEKTGMSKEEAALVLGGNMMRVAQQVWKS